MDRAEPSRGNDRSAQRRGDAVTMKAPELAAAIAPHLPGWTFEPAYDHIAYLVRADGARIGVMVGSWSAKGRVSIAGMWPKFADGSTYWSSRERAEITCAATRTPEAI